MSTAKDAQALAAYVAAMEQQHGHTPLVRDGALVDQRDEDRFAGWRLRGEAQAEPAAVAVVGERGSVSWRSEKILPVGAPLFAGPRPAAVAGDAVRAPLPVPTEILEARAQGRAEALAIILGLEAETGLDDYADSIPPGPAGEWGTAWNEEKLSELLRADDSAWSLLQEAEGEYWHNLGLREDAERMLAALPSMGGQSAPAATSTTLAANGPNIGITAEASESVHRGATEGSTNA